MIIGAASSVRHYDTSYLLGQQARHWLLLRPVNKQEQVHEPHITARYKCSLSFPAELLTSAKQNSPTQLCCPDQTNAMASLPSYSTLPHLCHEPFPSTNSDMCRHLPWMQYQNSKILVLVICSALYLVWAWVLFTSSNYLRSCPNVSPLGSQSLELCFEKCFIYVTHFLLAIWCHTTN
jgi:hypothetical protein